MTHGENKIDKTINNAGNKIDNAIDEVKESLYVRKLFTLIYAIIIGTIAGGTISIIIVAIWYGLLKIEHSDLGGIAATILGLIIGISTAMATYKKKSKPSK